MRWRRKRARPTGVTLPIVGGGLSWVSKTSEKEEIRRLVIDLGGRRALTGLADAEDEGHVGASILWIRGRLSEALHHLVDGSDATRLMEQLRESCNEYLTAVPDPPSSGEFRMLRPHALVALRQLRETFRVTLAYVGREGGLKPATDLADRLSAQVLPLDGPSRTTFVAPPKEMK